MSWLSGFVAVALFAPLLPVHAQTTLSATCGTVTIPSVVYTGQKIDVRVRVYNTSSIDLKSDAGFVLGSQEPQDNSNWGVTRVPIPNGIARRFQTTSFLFSVTAPSVSGQYAFAWQMLQEGNKWFGDVCKLATPVTVQKAENNAKVYSIAGIPTRVTIGDEFTAVIKMQNRGQSTWQPGAYKLGSTGPAESDRDNTIWGISRVELTETVLPNGIATFEVHATAPRDPGTYPFQWQMLQEGAEWFGSIASSPFRVRPLPAGATPLPVPEEFTCIVTKPVIAVGEPVTILTGPKDGYYSAKWYAAFGNPTTTTGRYFTTRFNQPGDQSITATSIDFPGGEQTATCTVKVVATSPSPNPYDPYNPYDPSSPFTAQLTSPISGAQVSQGQSLPVSVSGEGVPACGTWKIVTPSGQTVILVASNFASGQLPGNLPSCHSGPY